MLGVLGQQGDTEVALRCRDPEDTLTDVALGVQRLGPAYERGGAEHGTQHRPGSSPGDSAEAGGDGVGVRVSHAPLLPGRHPSYAVPTLKLQPVTSISEWCAWWSVMRPGGRLGRSSTRARPYPGSRDHRTGGQGLTP
jgi:hypothetical protein